LKFIDGKITCNVVHGYESDKHQKVQITERALGNVRSSTGGVITSATVQYSGQVAGSITSNSSGGYTSARLNASAQILLKWLIEINTHLQQS
jgi:hypothetical protein